MLALKLALRNITHSGLRSLLNVFILSFAFVLIVWTQGIYDGMLNQIKNSMIESEIGGGQLWSEKYNPDDPFGLEEAHSIIPKQISEDIRQNLATPILITPASIFPNGRIHSIVLKGISSSQQILNFPSELLHNDSSDELIPAIIGERMSKSAGLAKGDIITLRWRDSHGTFDATDIKIKEIISTTVQTIDAGQIWISLENLQKMLIAPNECTIVVYSEEMENKMPHIAGWIIKNYDYLLKELFDFIESKTVGSGIMYILLLAMALLAIFDTQVLAIFRRRKEMGTLMALGMTRGEIIKLFTLEGSLYGILALLLGAIYGTPLLIITNELGIGLPQVSQQLFSIGAKLYPTYGVKLFIGTSLILLISVIVVSYLPTRRISKLDPTEALRGKLS